MSEYRHVQIGYLLIISFGILIIFSAVLVVATSFTPGFLFAMIAFAIALTMFCNMTVLVDNRFIVVAFYLGLPRRSISLADVASCRVVRCPWYYGWGIRYTPRGWIFRISGLAAVEIELAKGKRFQIGTDEPDVLAGAIDRALNENLSS